MTKEEFKEKAQIYGVNKHTIDEIIENVENDRKNGTCYFDYEEQLSMMAPLKELHSYPCNLSTIE